MIVIGHFWSKKHIYWSYRAYSTTSMWWTEKKGLLQFITPAVTIWRHQTLVKLKTWHWVSRYVMFKKKERQTAKNHNDRWDDVHVHPFELVTVHKLSSSYVFTCIPYSHPLFPFRLFPHQPQSQKEKTGTNSNNNWYFINPFEEILVDRQPH